MANYAILGLFGAFFVAFGGALVLHTIYQILRISDLNPMGVFLVGFLVFY